MSHASIYASRAKPEVIPPSFDAVPDALVAEHRWVLWKLVWRGAWSKVPYAAYGRPARSNDESTWAYFDDVVAAYNRGGYDGIGFMLGDGFAGIDLDDCRDATTGKLKPWAKQLLRTIHTYAEVSPSGTGVKLIGRGVKTTDATRFEVVGGSVEVYDSARYFCITGHQAIRDVANISDAIAEIERSNVAPAARTYRRAEKTDYTPYTSYRDLTCEPHEMAEVIRGLYANFFCKPLPV